ncbi:MAG: Ig-like domain-containing domain [Candidatus Krumholzibacteriia bacterium]
MTTGRPAAAAHRLAGLAAALALALGAACATIEPPRGGPEDKTPPRLTAAWPESGAVGLKEVRELRFTFGEKVDPRQAARFIRTYPPLDIRNTAWEGRRTARIELGAPLPPDTVIVVEVPPGLPDMHRVVGTESRVWAIATADSLPGGEIAGSLVLGGKALRTGVVDLLPALPESLPWGRRPVLRRADTDSLGRFRFRWLDAPGGPWLLHAWADPDHDRRAGEGEAARLLPDTLRISAASPRLALAAITLHAPSDPGTVAGVVDSTPPWTAPLYGWVERITDSDSGWTAAPATRRPPGQQPVPRGTRVVWNKAGPGLVRLILFADLNGDSLLSVTALPPDSVKRWLEPHVLVDSLVVAPGLETVFHAPRFPATLTPWAGARADSGRAPPDTAKRR